MRGLLLLLVCCANVFAAVYSVGPGQQFNSVSSAVEYATSGDEIVVYGGTYYGPIFSTTRTSICTVMRQTHQARPAASSCAVQNGMMKWCSSAATRQPSASCAALR
jgi:hypothetical protein